MVILPGAHNCWQPEQHAWTTVSKVLILSSQKRRDTFWFCRIHLISLISDVGFFSTCCLTVKFHLTRGPRADELNITWTCGGQYLFQSTFWLHKTGKRSDSCNLPVVDLDRLIVGIGRIRCYASNASKWPNVHSCLPEFSCHSLLSSFIFVRFFFGFQHFSRLVHQLSKQETVQS